MNWEQICKRIYKEIADVGVDVMDLWFIDCVEAGSITLSTEKENFILELHIIADFEFINPSVIDDIFLPRDEREAGYIKLSIYPENGEVATLFEFAPLKGK